MPMVGEEAYWNRWNQARAADGLRGERLGLCEAVVAEFSRLKFPEKARLLEVGCGAGWIGEKLFKLTDYLGIDYSSAAIESARARVPQADFRVADFLETKLCDTHFDAILCIDTIAYFRDQDAAMRRMARALRPGGFLLLTTVNPTCYSRMSRIGPPAPGQIRTWLRKRQLLQLITRHGLTVLKTRTILPAGDMGFLRIINSRKLNAAISMIVGARLVSSVKEWFGLGQFRLVLAANLQ